MASAKEVYVGATGVSLGHLCKVRTTGVMPTGINRGWNGLLGHAHSTPDETFGAGPTVKLSPETERPVARANKNSERPAE